MNKKALKSAWMLTLAGSLAMTACSGSDTDDTGNNNNNDGGTQMDGTTGSDTGPTDNGGRVDAGDAGVRDNGTGDGGGGMDAQSPDRRPPVCPPGSEGCECISTRAPDGEMFLQDDCAADMLCVDWDVLSQRTDLTGTFQSCVKPCQADAECGAGRACRPVLGVNANFTGTGADMVCVDRVASFDEWCGLSKLAVSVDPDPGVEIQTAGEIVGCGPEAECQMNFFGDVHPSEGICLGVCEADADCSAPTSICNTQRFALTSTTNPFLGICQESLAQRGQLCGTTDPDKQGITSGCAAGDLAIAPNTVCVGLGGLFDEGLGTCLTQCDDLAMPCPAARPGRPDEQCLPMFFNDGSGVCNENCSLFGETCPATGGEANLGYTCFEIHRLFDFMGDEVSQCMERIAPPIQNVAVLDAASGMLTSQGDNCWATGGSNNYLACPYPNFCEIVDFQGGQGICVSGCGLNAPGDGSATCPTLTGVATSTCVAVFMGNTDDGLCGQ